MADSGRQPATNTSENRGAGENVFVDPSLPGPVAVPLVPTITATMTDALINDDGDGKADPTNGIPGTTEKIKYTVTISNSGTDATNVVYTNQIDAHTTLVNGSITTQPIAVNDSYSVLGNVRIQVPDGASDLLGNDCDPDPLGGPCTNTGLTISVLAGDNSAPFAGTSTQGGNVTAATSDGSFQYNPAPGFTGSDSFTYTVTDSTGKTDTATVNLTVSGMIWFVDDNAAGGGDGRLTNPFNCLTGAGCFNLVAADDPGDNIFLYSGTYNNTSVFALLDTQKLIGQGSNAATTLAAIAGVTVPTHSDALPTLNGDPSTVTVNSTASGIQLEQDNTLRGFTVGNTIGTGSNYDIQNTTTQTVGTLSILEVILNGTGGLFRADSGGVLSVTFNSASTTAAGGDGFQIGSASGAVTVNGSGTISGVAGTDVNISAGTVSFTSSGNINHTSANAMVSVSGGHATGTVTFTGTLSATNGTGLQFNNADSTTSYNFNGTTTLNGGDAGIDILNGSGGTFSFNSNTSISNPTGTAFYVNASAASVTMNGTITQGATKRGVFLENNTGGSTTFTGTLTLNTTTQNAFEATHTSLAGTVTVQTATNNVLSTTTGTALRINNVNIGASDVTFQSISANGAASGIILNNTGSSGGLNVTGTGTTDGTGGTIQSTTGDAVSLTTTRSVVLKNMIIGDNAAVHTESVSATNNIGDDGISCTSVTPVAGDTYGLDIDNLKIARTAGGGIDGAGGGNIGLHVNNTEIINPGDVGTPSSTSSDEDAIGYGSGFAGNADQLTGTVLIENSTFAAFIDHGFQIENSGSGTANITISNVTMKNNDGLTLCSGGPCEGSAVQVIADGSTIAGGTGPTINLTVRQLTVTNIDQDGIDAIADPGGNINVTVGDPANAATNGMTFNCPNGDQVLRFNSGSPDSDDNASFNFNVRNVIVSNSPGTLVIFKAANQMTGKFINSTLDQNNATATTLASRGIEITADGDASLPGSNEVPSMNILIDNVTLNRIGGDGIQAFLTDVNNSSSRLDLTIQNCNIGTNPANTAQTGLEIGLNNALASEGIEIRNGVTTGANGQLYAHISNNNIRNATSASGSADGIDIDAEISTTSHVTVVNNDIFAAPGTTDYDLAVEATTAFMCADFTGNNDSNDANSGADITNNGDAADFQIENGSASLAGNNPGTSPFNFTGTFVTGPCTMPNTPSGAFFALNNNQSNQQTYLASLTTAQVANDLPADILASAENALSIATLPAAPATVTQPSLVNQVAHSANEGHSLVASIASAAEVRDFSAAHHAAPAIKSHDSAVNNAEVAANHAAVSKLETRNTNVAATAAAAPMVGETVTINIGTLRAGDSIEITYEVTVNNPPDLNNPVNPLVVTQPAVATQGSVSYNDGATPQTPVLTDEVAGGAVTPTETPVDLFDSQTTLTAAPPSPSNQGDSVTFTATVAIHPSQVPTPPAPLTPTGTVDFMDSVTAAVIPGCDDVALNGSGVAQCTTSGLSGVSHDITAVYTGDGNYDGNTSNTVTYVVIPCTTNPVVTSTADSGGGSLREAIGSACSAPNNNITFNLAGAGPHLITLTTGELAVAKNVNINNNSGESITVSGGGTSRVFNVNSGKTVSISNLTISGGNNVSSGGGILNDHGTLTLTNVTVSGNTGGAGGGIYVDGGTSGSASLTVISSTISGNTSSVSGGGIYINGLAGGAATLVMTNSTVSGNNAAVHGGGVAATASTTSTLTNVTVTDNRADNDNNGTGGGGGLASFGTMTLSNTILAGNFNEDGVTDASDDANGSTFEAASANNLIGNGDGTTGITNGVNNNQVGSGGSPIDAKLGLLANNGGPTMTHALLADSPAIEAGSNTIADGAGLTDDQRGTGYPRKADSADPDTIQTVDIGAFELHPSIENIANQNTTEDTPINFNFNIGDDTGALITGGGGSVTATSSNTTLVPNLNLSVTDPAPPGGGARNLSITPAANQSGTTTITVTVTATNGRTATDTFDLNVTADNDNPTLTINTGLTVDEASTGNIIDNTRLKVDDVDNTAAQLTYTVGTAPANGTLKNNGVGLSSGGMFTQADIDGNLLTYDHNGSETTSDSFTFTVSDGAGGSIGSTTFNITVTAQNDAPTIGNNTGTTVNEGSTGNVIDSARLSVNDVDNTPAQLTFTVGTAPANGTLRKSGGALAGGGMFTQQDINNNLLTYDHDGTDTTSDSFTFTVSDGAGGSISTTTFNITVTAQNDAPVVTTTVANLSYSENDPATPVDTGLTVTDSDSANLTGASASITAHFQSGQDVLGWVDNNLADNITLDGSSTPQTIVLTGSDTPANYQAALRAVTYQNSSENPSTLTRTVTFTANDGTTTGQGTRGIAVNALNDNPTLTTNAGLTVVSGGTGTIDNTKLKVDDPDNTAAQLTFTVGTATTNGTLKKGLATLSAGGMFTQADIDGNQITYTHNGTGTTTDSFTFTVSDGAGGSIGSTTFNITIGSPNVSVHDAKVAEPSSGTVDMVFTVALAAPAGASGASVNFTTADEPPGPGKAVAGTCGAGGDYATTSGTVDFFTGQQVKTINVPVCSDGLSEPDETFLVNLSGAVNATILDGQATGTITAANPAGEVLISEIRTTGPGGAGDDFVELYNNSNSPKDISGYGLFKKGSDCNVESPVLIATIPGASGSNTTVIPARGHYLLVGSQYSLSSYPGGNNGVTATTATGDQTLTADIETDANVGLFSTADLLSISTLNRVDAVGFGLNTGGTCNLLREGSTLPPIASNPTIEHSYFRKMCDWIQGSGCTVPGIPKDTNQNADDFWLADTAGSPITGRLGAPGPENLTSPIRRDNAGINVFVLDGTVGAGASPNRQRDGGDPDGTFGTMTLRYRVINNTGGNVTRLRYRIVDISTAIQSGGSVADLRALSGLDVSVNPVNDPAICSSQGAGAPPCTVLVRGTTLETPPAQAPPQDIGGGYNSTLSSGTVTLGTPLANGATLPVYFKLGVEKTGTFRFYIIVEALP